MGRVNAYPERDNVAPSDLLYLESSAPESFRVTVEKLFENVVERGSNSNGEFVRFADGTQICFPRVTPIWSSSDPAFSSTQSFANPATFVSPPTGGAMGIGSGNTNGQLNYASIRANGPGAGNTWFCRFTGEGPGGSGAEAELSAILIGRWF